MASHCSSSMPGIGPAGPGWFTQEVPESMNTGLWRSVLFEDHDRPLCGWEVVFSEKKGVGSSIMKMGTGTGGDCPDQGLSPFCAGASPHFLNRVEYS